MRRILLSILGISACASSSLFAGKSDNVCSKCQQSEIAAYDSSEDDEDEGMRQEGMRRDEGMRQQGMRQEGMRQQGMRQEGMRRDEGMREDEEGMSSDPGSTPAPNKAPAAPPLRTPHQPTPAASQRVQMHVNKLENMTPAQAHRSMETLRKSNPALYKETMSTFKEQHNGMGPVEHARAREAEGPKY